MPDYSDDSPPQEHARRARTPQQKPLPVSATLAVLLLAWAASGCGSSSSPAASASESSRSTSASTPSSSPTFLKPVAGPLIDPKEASSSPHFNIDTVLHGIPQNGRYIGSATAPVTLQYFNDVACPPSREITTGPLVSLIERWVRPGRLRIEFRSVEEGTEPGSFVSEQAAALAAGAQNKLWWYIEYYYSAQFENLEEEAGSGTNIDSCHPLAGLAQKAARGVPGLDFQRWQQDLHQQQVAAAVMTDQRTAARAGLDNPGYLIGPTGTPTATTLSKFSRIDPAYDEVVHELLTAVVHL